MFRYFEMYLEQEKVVRMNFAERPNPILAILLVFGSVSFSLSLDFS